MALENIFQIIFAAIGAIGGISLVVYGLSRWIGAIIRDRLIESIKHQNQQELEQYRTQSQHNLESFRHELTVLSASSDRYFGKQFELYSKLWHSLYELKSKADTLWNHADNKTLMPFIKQLKKTSDEVEKSYLFLENDHYIALTGLLEEFKNFMIGKVRLIELREKSLESINPNQIRNVIEGNKQSKDNYNHLINQIKQDLKQQLRGNRNFD